MARRVSKGSSCPLDVLPVSVLQLRASHLYVITASSIQLLPHHLGMFAKPSEIAGVKTNINAKNDAAFPLSNTLAKLGLNTTSSSNHFFWS